MTSRRAWLAYVYVLAVFVGFLALSALLHLPHDAEHWSADFVTAKFSPRLKTQHQSIVLVYISPTTLARYPYVSPIDRGLIAELLQAVDQAGAKVIGLDVILDRYTEPKKDEALRWALRHTKAKMVLGVIREPKNGPHVQSEYFLASADGNDPAVGYLYFDEHHYNALVVSDHVVRFMAELPGGGLEFPGKGQIRESFAEVLAHAAGTDFKPQSPYISWLLPPADGTDTFMTLAADDVLGWGNAKLNLADLLHDKFVLIGGNFDDRDRHLTPLSVSRDDFYTGPFIHAQILAQLLAGRSVRDIGVPLQLLVALVAALAGYWLGRRSGRYFVWLELASVIAVVLVGFLAFSLFSTIFPYNLVVITLLTGAAAGHYGRVERARVVPKIPATQEG